MYRRTSPGNGRKGFRQNCVAESGAVLIEAVLVFGLMLPIFGGMLMVSQASQERALVGQILRASTRPVTFHETIDVLDPNGDADGGSELEDVQDAVC